MLWLDDEHNHYEDSVIDPTYTQKKKKKLNFIYALT